MAIDPHDLELSTLTALAGAAVSAYALQRARQVSPALRASHGYVIQRLIDSEPTIGELAGELGVTQQAASKSVAEMEAAGLVTRRPDAADRRIRRIKLTASGRDVLEAGRRARRELDRAVPSEPAILAAARQVLLALLDATGELDAVAARRARPPAD